MEWKPSPIFAIEVSTDTKTMSWLIFNYNVTEGSFSVPVSRKVHVKPSPRDDENGK